jgi:VWFA-related protein
MNAISLSLCVVAVGGALLAQSAPQGTMTFRASTELVEVDVSVTGPDGKPIRGLTAADFAIVGQKIVAFQEVTHDTPDDPARAAMLRVPHDVADNQTARTATLALIVLDDGVPREERLRARDTIRQVVDLLGPGVQIGLLSTSGRLGFELTDDRARLLAAINRLQWRETPTVVRPGRVVTGTCNFGLFEQAARMLAPMAARRKAVIAVTAGCPGDIKGSVESMAASPSDPNSRAAVQMVDVMRRANVAFYAIDPRGAVAYSLGHFVAPNIMTSSNPNPEDGIVGRYEEREAAAGASLARAVPHAAGMVMVTRHYDPIVQSQENLDAVGSVTGGFAVTNTADIDGGIRRLVNDFDHYYLLGFTPTDRRGFEKLNVRVSREGAVLRYRRGYTTDPVKRRAGGDPALPTISGVMPNADVPLRLLAMPFATRTGARELMAVEVRVPRAELGPAGAALSDDVTVTVAAVRSDQARVERAFKFTRHVSITAKMAAEAGDTVAYQIVRAIDLPPGPYQLRVSVTSATLGRTGSVYLTTDVPDYANRPFELSGPLVAFADTERRPAAATIVDAGLPSMSPVFDRVFAAGDVLRVLCPLFSGGASPSGARIDLVDERGRIVSTKETGIQSSGIYGVDAVLNLRGLASGPYRLRVTAISADASSTREVGIVIR